MSNRRGPVKSVELGPKQRFEIEKRQRKANDKRIFVRLSALLWLDDGLTQDQVARMLGMTKRQVSKWVGIFRDEGLDALCTLNYPGDPGALRAEQLASLKAEIRKGVFHNTNQIRDWIYKTFQVRYSSSGVKALLHRIGASYHKVSGFFWKADRKEQIRFKWKYRRHTRELKPGTRRYFVDACHPIWGLNLLYSCWLVLGQRFHVGVGNGRKRLNIRGAYCPEDHEYLDLRLVRGNITGEQFVHWMRLLRDRHPEAKQFILYLDNAKYYDKPCVQEWLKRHPEFQLEPIPAYSPNLNLIERLWKFLRTKALNRWHPTFAAMQAAVSRVLDRLEDYHAELDSLMSGGFHILRRADLDEAHRILRGFH